MDGGKKNENDDIAAFTGNSMINVQYLAKAIRLIN